MKTWTLIVALSSLAACAQPPAAPAAAAPASPAAEPAAPAAPSAPATPATEATTPATAAAPEYEFAFNLKQADTSANQHVVRKEKTPCGEVAIAKTASIPMDDPVLAPDFVVEFDQTGRELQRWGRPFEADVLAFDKGRVQFKTDAGAFWTDSLGTVEKVAAPAAATSAEFLKASAMVDCPALDAFKGSDSVQCFKVKDGAGDAHLLALEGACS